MRLLKFDDEGELNLTKDICANVPPYAILSHTWGNDRDEVSFMDLEDRTHQNKPGYSKIRFCSANAQRDNLSYFWVDTCCINTRNQAECSEAINSMFRWYRDAVKCYVYLSDVSIHHKDNDHTEPAWESQFRKSRWFTRGWTLQELIAPASVEFFSREGTPLGSKSTLEQLIHEITTIPISALRGASLTKFAVDERLRWAIARNTKREEDKAYCLLGIFNVIMPLAYGEGKYAFLRLKGEIDKSLSANSMPPTNHRLYNLGPLDIQTAQHIPADESRKPIQNDPAFTDSGYGSVPSLNYPMNASNPPLGSQDLDNPIPSDTVNDKVGEETETQYSAASSVAPAEVQHYIVELCNDVFHKLGQDFDVKGWSSLSSALPSLIKAFAIMLGYESSTPVNQEIMYFIHSKHKDVATKLEAILQQEDDVDSKSGRKITDMMSLSDKMSMWESKAGADQLDPGKNDDLFTGVEDTQDEYPELADLPLYNRIILASAAYKWFVANLQKELVLQWSETQPYTMIEDIRRKILDELPTGRISKRRAPCAYKVKFDVEWLNETEQTFLRKISEQSIESKESCADLFTTTGGVEEAQALTIEKYLDQTWPVRGLQLLEVIQEAVISHDRCCSVILPDNTQLEAIVGRSCLSITATGPAYFVAECGEQISWLGAALQCNSGQSFSICTPSITNYSIRQVTPFSTKTNYQNHYKIGFNFSPPITFEDPVPDKQKYWQDLVGESILISGFPISRRPDGYPGLEVSFETLLSLLEADTASLNGGLIMVKGRKTTLWLTKHTRNVYLWRQLDDSTDIGPACVDDHVGRYHDSVDLRSLEIGRHILSKCQEVQTATAKDMNLDRISRTSGVSENKSSQLRFRNKTASPGAGRNLCRNLKSIRQDESHSLDLEPCNDEIVSRSSIIGTVSDSNSRHAGPRFGMNELERYPSSSVPYLFAVDENLEATAGSSVDSLESDLLSISDSSEDESLDLDERVYEVLNIVLRRLLSGFRSNIRDCVGPNERQGGSTGSASAAGSSETGSTPGPSQKRTRAQQVNDNDHDDTGKDETSMPPPKKGKKIDEETSQKSLACPYLKLGPIKYRKCCANKHTRIRDVKQHLYRRHTPPHYCQRCFSTFEDEASMKRHVDVGTCQTEDPTILDGISYHQRQLLGRKSKAGLNEEGQWFAIWKLLFPGRRPPISAYLNTDLSIEMRELREYCLQRGPALLREQLQSDQCWLSQELDAEQRQVAQERLLGQGLISMFESWHCSIVSMSASGLLLGSDLRSTSYTTSTSSIADSGVALESQHSPGETALQQGESSQPLENLNSGSQPAEAIDPVQNGSWALQEDLGTLGAGDGQALIDHADDVGLVFQESLGDPLDFLTLDSHPPDGSGQIVNHEPEALDTAHFFWEGFPA